MLRNIFRRGCLHHSVYDWLNLISNLFIPLIVGILTIAIPLQEKFKDQQNENYHLLLLRNRFQNMEILHDEQKQSILNTYQRDLTSLILQLNSSNYSTYANSDTHDERLLLIIRMRTFHALRQLDPNTKMTLLQLLIDSGIQHRINISHADLSSLIFPPNSFYHQLQFINIQARNLTLNNLTLYQSNFSYSILDDSLLLHSNCSYTDFSHASLQRTDWTNTDLTQAIFNSSNLLGAKITNEQLATTQSLQDAILPNGTVVTV